MYLSWYPVRVGGDGQTSEAMPLQHVSASCWSLLRSAQSLLFRPCSRQGRFPVRWAISRESAFRDITTPTRVPPSSLTALPVMRHSMVRFFFRPSHPQFLKEAHHLDCLLEALLASSAYPSAPICPQALLRVGAPPIMIMQSGFSPYLFDDLGHTDHGGGHHCGRHTSSESSSAAPPQTGPGERPCRGHTPINPATSNIIFTRFFPMSWTSPPLSR